MSGAKVEVFYISWFRVDGVEGAVRWLACCWAGRGPARESIQDLYLVEVGARGSLGGGLDGEGAFSV